MLLGVDSDLVKLLQVVTADAGTRRSAVAIVGEALAVELQAFRLAAIAGLVGR